MTLTILICYLAALVILGCITGWMSRGTAKDYALASQTIGPVLLLLSLFGTTMTAFALVGSTAESFVSGVGVFGMLATAAGIVHSACFFLVGVKLWTLGKKFGYSTQIQYFRDRLQSEHIGLLLFPVLVGLVIPYMLVGLIGGALTVQDITRGSFAAQGWFAEYGNGVPPWLSGLVISLVVLSYVFFGGMRGTAWANAMQTLIFVVLGVVAFFVIANHYGGGETILDSMRNLSANVNDAHLSKELIPYSKYAAFLLIPLSVAMFPHVFQHWLTARSAKTFKLAIVAHPLMVLVVWMPCVLMGAWATGIAATQDFTPKDAGRVLATLVAGIDNKVLTGFLSAGILAAIMSSLDSQFLALGTMFTNDIFTHYMGENRYSDRQRVMISRVFVLLVVGVTYVIFLFAVEHRAGVFNLGEWCFTGFTGLFPVVFGSLYWKRFTKAGAMASIVVTAATWLVLFWRSGFGDNRGYVFPEAPSAYGVHPIVTITGASLLAAVVVSLLTRPPDAEVVRKYFPEPPRA